MLISARSSYLCSLSLPSTTIPSSSTPSHLTQKPTILELKSIIRSAPFSTFRPSKPTFSPANDDDDNNNRETRYSGQIPNSTHSSLLENELRDSLRKSMDYIRGLKNAFTVLGFGHIGIVAWAAGSLPYHPSFSTQGFLASVVPFLLAINTQRFLQMMSSLNMKTEGGLVLISKLAWLAAWRLFIVVVCLFVVQLGVLLFMPHDLLMIPSIRVSTITMTLLSVLCAIHVHRLPSTSRKLVDWQLQGKVDEMIWSSNWRERREVLKVANTFLLRFRNASYLAAGLSCSWLLYVHLHDYGIIKYHVFE